MCAHELILCVCVCMCAYKLILCVCVCMCVNELIMCVRVCMRACDRTRNTNTVHNQFNSMSSHTYKIYVSTDIYVNLSFSLLETQKLLWQRKRKVKYASSIKRCLFDLYLCIVVISCYLCAKSIILNVMYMFPRMYVTFKI